VSIKDKRVGFLGAGNMGEAIIKGLLQTGLVPASAIAATDVRADRLQQLASQYGIGAASSNHDLVAKSDVVILAVKPQIMGAVLKEIAGAVDRTRLLISVAAGVPVARLREGLGKDARLIEAGVDLRGLERIYCQAVTRSWTRGRDSELRSVPA